MKIMQITDENIVKRVRRLFNVKAAVGVKVFTNLNEASLDARDRGVSFVRVGLWNESAGEDSYYWASV